MGENSGIKYVDRSIGFWVGCDKVSDGCLNCYMFTEQKRYGGDPTVVRRTSRNTWHKPFVKNRKTKEYNWKPGERVFVCPWSDFFHKDADAWREDAWQVIYDRPDLHWVIVTKRIHDAAERLPKPFTQEAFPNITILATCENQEMADLRIPPLLKLKQKHPFVKIGVSAEPLLGEINFGDVTCGECFCPECQEYYDEPYEFQSPCCAAEYDMCIDGQAEVCRECGDEFNSDELVYVCPKCGNDGGGRYIGPHLSECVYSGDKQYGAVIKHLDAVIIGAENAYPHLVRVCKTEWIDNLTKQCKDAKVPVLIKQWHTDDRGKLKKNPKGGWPE